MILATPYLPCTGNQRMEELELFSFTDEETESWRSWAAFRFKQWESDSVRI